MFEDPYRLVLGLVTGFVFGVLLQKGQVSKFQNIMGQLLLKDWKVLKIMVTAIAVGTVGVHMLVLAEQASLHIQAATLARVIFGGIIFGVGLAIFGLCPGTSVAACGEGRRDAMVGVVGMFLGAGTYVAAFSVVDPFMKLMPDYGKVTLPQLTGTTPWLWAIGVAAIMAIALVILERLHPSGLDAEKSVRAAAHERRQSS